MRAVILLVCLLSCSSKLFSQELEGEWKGFFTDETPGFHIGGETVINFFFTKLNDTTFQAFSKTIISSGKDKDSSVCILQGGFANKDVLYLEETRTIKEFENGTGCKQMMKLYYYKRKKQLEISGNWYTENNACGYGRISLFKKL